MNQTQTQSQTIKHAAIGAAGVLVGASAFYAGVKFGISQKSLIQELHSHQMIAVALAQTNPEALQEAVDHISDAVKAATQIVPHQ